MVFQHETLFFYFLCLLIIKEDYTDKKVKEKERAYQNENNEEISIVSV